MQDLDGQGKVLSLGGTFAANAAKLQSNDLITELNGQSVANLEEFKKQLQDFRKDKPREAIVMVALREGNTQTIRIEPPQ